MKMAHESLLRRLCIFHKNLGAAIQIDPNWIKIKQQDTIIKQQAQIIQLLKETR
ncbi:hypothetical protein ACQUE6_06730 [Enterococcus casseliflavus]|uniref:hypothetical protein n=1 Tax=Enterococcus TaxID=1350 RepID=UPI001BCD72B2|nr:hypothetical protein [Enterococcus casseliflavus]WBY91554.1 hypothetical protein PEZ80_12965 [Enterococcus casseliflavus]